MKITDRNCKYKISSGIGLSRKKVNSLERNIWEKSHKVKVLDLESRVGIY